MAGVGGGIGRAVREGDSEGEAPGSLATDSSSPPVQETRNASVIAIAGWSRRGDNNDFLRRYNAGSVQKERLRLIVLQNLTNRY
jgi:hypothetical protein